MGFLQNQMVAREMTNLTPIQLEEFESVFRHFDRDMSNTLQELEFSAALASLGLVYDDEEMHREFVAVSQGRRGVTFEQFIRFMVEVTEDQNTAEQVFQSFKEVADGKVRTPLFFIVFTLLLCLFLFALFQCVSSFFLLFGCFPFGTAASSLRLTRPSIIPSLLQLLTCCAALRHRTRPPPLPRPRRSHRRAQSDHASA